MTPASRQPAHWRSARIGAVSSAPPALLATLGRATMPARTHPCASWHRHIRVLRAPSRWRTPARFSSALDSARMTTPSTRLSHWPLRREQLSVAATGTTAPTGDTGAFGNTLSTRCAPLSALRREAHDGHQPRRLQLDRMDAGGTSPWMGEVEVSLERNPRAMQEQLPRTPPDARDDTPCSWHE